MSEQPQSLVIQQEARRQYELLRSMLAIAAAASLLLLAVFVVLAVAYPGFPLLPLLIVGAFLLSAGLSLAFLRGGRQNLAVGVFMVGLVVVSFALVYFFNGVRGPMTVVLISIPVVAGLLGRRHTARWVFLVGGLYLIVASLEALGVIQPYKITGLPGRLAYHSTFILALANLAYLVTAAARGTREVLLAEEERSGQLAEANLQLERAAQAEAEARRREEQIALWLQRAVARYSDYLRQVAAGNYEARLDVAAEQLDLEGEVAAPVEELTILGQQIEDTVQALVEAVNSLQIVQRRYVREAWEEFAQRARQQDFRYAPGGDGAPSPRAGDDRLASMAETVREQKVTAGKEELALPITLRGQILGAIGLRREAGEGWSEAELALAETVSDQLAQTIESLRLLDETQRRAARDRLMSEVTARIRETLEVETVLKTAVDEIGAALGLAALDLRLSLDDGGPGTGLEYSKEEIE